MDRFSRAHLINSLSGFKSVSLIATVDPSGRSNLAIFSNIVHLGADPALIGFVNRPVEAAPHTMGNIEKTGIYTINHIHEEIMAAAHQTSAKYPEGVSEFDATGLTPEYYHGITVPYVRESRVKYRLQLREIIPIRHNNTFFVIGEIVHIIIPAEIISQDGFLSLEDAGTMCSLGIDAYYTTQKRARLAYARP
jgi:flavin reductase (DIM6/NTAB) family NADH-FMN oxidoreductase RutF